MGNCLVRYASRVVIYDHRAFIRLATAFKKDHNRARLRQVRIIIFSFLQRPGLSSASRGFKNCFLIWSFRLNEKRKIDLLLGKLNPIWHFREKEEREWQFPGLDTLSKEKRNGRLK